MTNVTQQKKIYISNVGGNENVGYKNNIEYTVMVCRHYNLKKL